MWRVGRSVWIVDNEITKIDDFRAWRLNALNFELTKIKNILKCLDGFDKLNVRKLKGRGSLERIQKHTIEERIQKSMKLSIPMF